MNYLKVQDPCFDLCFVEIKPKTFVQCWNKVGRKYIQEQQPNQFYCYNQNMGFFHRMDQSVAKYKIGIRMKKWWWSPFV